MRPCIIWLDDITADHHAMVGAKAANLARLAKEGFPVPDGFVITTELLQRWIAAGGLGAALSGIDSLAQDRRARQRAARQVQALFAATDLPADDWRLVTDAYHRLAERRGSPLTVAVRSSFAAEDSAVSSFAGQMETVLDVADLDGLRSALPRCFASLWSDSSVAYRARRGNLTRVGGGVLVQAQVQPRWSGVLFAVSPVGQEGCSLIEALPSCASGVVDGSADPHRVLLDPDRGRLITCQPPRNAQAALSEKEKATLTAMASRLVQTGRALGLGDFEWALNEDGFHLLQGRPLTNADPESDAPRDDLLWSRVLGEEFWSGPVTPLMFSIVGSAIEQAMIRRPIHMLGKGLESDKPYLALIHDHIFVNLTALEPVVQLIPQWALTDDVLKMFPADLRQRILHHAGLVLPLDLLPALGRFHHDKAPWWVSSARNDFNRFVEEQLPRVKAFKPPAPDSDGPVFAAALDELTQWLRSYLSITVWGVTYAYLFVPLARSIIAAWFKTEDQQRLQRLALSYLPQDRAFDSARRLTELASQVRRTSCWDQLSPGMPFDRARSLLMRSRDGVRFLAAFDEFLADHGHRTVDRDILYPRWSDDPGIPFAMLLNLSQRPTPAQSMPASEAEVRRELERALPIRWTNLFAPAKLPALKLIVTLARDFLPVRENMRYYADVFLYAMRRLALARAEGLVRRGVLSPGERDLVFFLEPDDLFDDRTDWSRRLRAARRRQERFAANRSRRLPAYLFNGEDYEALTEPLEPGEVIKGLAASSGVGRGKVRVVRCYQDFFAFKPGEVLVVPSLDPSWSSLLPLAAAVVTEVGGQLSHGAIVAREFGVPAVVGVPRVTHLVENGDALVVNGAKGEIILPSGG